MPAPTLQRSHICAHSCEQRQQRDARSHPGRTLQKSGVGRLADRVFFFFVAILVTSTSTFHDYDYYGCYYDYGRQYSLDFLFKRLSPQSVGDGTTSNDIP